MLLTQREHFLLPELAARDRLAKQEAIFKTSERLSLGEDIPVVPMLFKDAEAASLAPSFPSQIGPRAPNSKGMSLTYFCICLAQTAAPAKYFLLRLSS